MRAGCARDVLGEVEGVAEGVAETVRDTSEPAREPLRLGERERDAVPEGDGDSLRKAESEELALCDKDRVILVLRELLALAERDVDGVTLGGMLRLAAALAVAVSVGERLPEADGERDVDGEADVEGERAAAGQAPASRLAICRDVSAASQTRTSVKLPTQGICLPPSRNGALPHIAAAPETLCGATQGAEVDVQTGAAAESTYTATLNGPAGAATGVVVRTSVCHAPSAMPAVKKQSLEVPTVWQSGQAGHIRTSVSTYAPALAPAAM